MSWQGRSRRFAEARQDSAIKQEEAKKKLILLILEILEISEFMSRPRRRYLGLFGAFVCPDCGGFLKREKVRTSDYGYYFRYFNCACGYSYAQRMVIYDGGID